MPLVIGTSHKLSILSHSDSGLLIVGMCNSDSQLWRHVGLCGGFNSPSGFERSSIEIEYEFSFG